MEVSFGARQFSSMLKELGNEGKASIELEYDGNVVKGKTTGAAAGQILIIGTVLESIAEDGGLSLDELMNATLASIEFAIANEKVNELS